MGVTILKQVKPATKSKAVASEKVSNPAQKNAPSVIPDHLKGKVGMTFQTRVEEVDKLADLKPKIKALEELKKEYDALASTLKDIVEKEVSADEKATFVGTTSNFVVDEKSNERTVTSMKELHKKMGDKTFYAVATISMKDVDRYLSTAEQAKLVATTRTGPRKGHVVPK